MQEEKQSKVESTGVTNMLESIRRFLLLWLAEMGYEFPEETSEDLGDILDIVRGEK